MSGVPLRSCLSSSRSLSSARRLVQRALNVEPRVHFSPSTENRTVWQALDGMSSRVPLFYYITEMRVRKNLMESPDDCQEVVNVVREAVRKWRRMSAVQKRSYRLYALRQKIRVLKLAREQARLHQEQLELAHERELIQARQMAYQRARYQELQIAHNQSMEQLRLFRDHFNF